MIGGLLGRVFKRSSTDECADAVPGVMEDLERMNRATEADFLAIAEKLNAILGAARGISERTREMAGSLTGESSDDASAALMSLLEDARQRQARAAVLDCFAGIRELAGRIRGSLAGLRGVGPWFHAMATLAATETARLGAAGLDLAHLGEAFRSAGADIQERVQQILDGEARLEKRIAATLAEAAEFEGRALAALPALLTAAEQGLGGVRAGQEAAGAALARLSSESDAVTEDVGEIVTLLQSHDIARQQVEHVVEAMGALSGGSGAPERTAVIDLQMAQLAHAAETFSDAVRRMDSRLAQAAARIDRMREQSGALLCSSSRGDSDFFSDMEKRFRAVAEMSAQSKALERRGRGALEEFERTLADLTPAADELQGVGLRLRWLAVNAAVSAAHVGAGGEPLEAVADALRRLVTECESASGGASEAIQALAAAVAPMIEGLARQETAEEGAISARLRTKIGELQGWNDRARAANDEIAKMAAGLSAEVRELRSGFSAGRLFATTVEGCMRTLRAVSERASYGGALSRTEALRGLEARYTMHAEREVHEALAGGPAEAPLELPVAAADLGENVELF